MCLAVAAKIVKMIDSFSAEVEVDGVLMKISTALIPEVQLADFVLVHAGFAIEIIDQMAAEENLRIWKQLHEVG